MVHHDAFYIPQNMPTKAYLAINRSLVDFNGYIDEYTLSGSCEYELNFVLFSMNFSPVQHLTSHYTSNELLYKEDIEMDIISINFERAKTSLPLVSFFILSTRSSLSKLIISAPRSFVLLPFFHFKSSFRFCQTVLLQILGNHLFKNPCLFSQNTYK